MIDWKPIENREGMKPQILVSDGNSIFLSRKAFLYKRENGEIAVPANFGGGMIVKWYANIELPTAERKVTP